MIQDSPYTFCLATTADRQDIIDFVNSHWNEPHPLVNNTSFFDFYYNRQNGFLRFCLAKHGGKIAALAGYIPANYEETDLWVSLWVSDRAASGSGLELMEALPRLTGCNTLACNNIRPATIPFYHFLGYSTGRVSHYYRLSSQPIYQIAQVTQLVILPVGGGCLLSLLPDEQAFQRSLFVPPEERNPRKDLWYISRRFYHSPFGKYQVYGVYPTAKTTPEAILVIRETQVAGTTVLRIVDYIGPSFLFPQMGTAIDALLTERGAEYIDFYCVGLSSQTLWEAGFVERLENDPNIIPNYLSPPIYKNTEYYYFTNRPDRFILCKSDGDQDRPR